VLSADCAAHTVRAKARVRSMVRFSTDVFEDSTFEAKAMAKDSDNV